MMSENKIASSGITIVIATYNRPAVLRSCVKSVLLQTYKDWKLYIIGDNCSSSTADMLSEFTDPRICYYNNPFRFGEQSGGNSIGAALATTKYIAYLNHDDLWSPDHLEVAYTALEQSEKDIYMGRSITSKYNVNGFPEFTEVTNKYRKPYWAFIGEYLHFEPCSTWVIRTSFVQKIGPWKQSTDLHRLPIVEYVLRMWHRKGKFLFGDKVTCVKLNQHIKNTTKGNQYDYPGKEQELIVEMFAKEPEKFFELTVESLLKPKTFIRIRYNKGSKWENFKYSLLVNRTTAYLYYFTGKDLYETFGESLRWEKGKFLKEALHRRTGEVEMNTQSMEEVINYSMKFLLNSRKE